MGSEPAYFALDPSGRLIFATTELMAYCKSSTKLCGYPPGVLQINDLIICISGPSGPNSRLATLLNRKMREFGESTDKIPLREPFVFLWKYMNPDVAPVLKTWGFDRKRAARVLLDTIFDGQRICISAYNCPMDFCIDVDGQFFHFALSEAQPEALAVCHAHGIRYFSARLPEPAQSEVSCRSVKLQDEQDRSASQGSSKKVSINVADEESILNGEKFAGYIDCNELYSLKAEDIFHEVLVQAIKRLDAYKPDGAIDQCGAKGFSETEQLNILKSEGTARFAIFPMEGRAFFLRKLSGCEAADVCLYQVGTEKHLTATLGAVAQIHAQLDGFADGLSPAHHLSASFRLRGNDLSIREIQRLLGKVADKKVVVLLTGESGTGKTFLAKEIHRNSRRSTNAFVSVNCAAIPYSLLESELFGYDDGAFTGARRGGKQGYFELADGGTLFLDEITEIPLPLQGKLLEVIQGNTFFRVGGIKKVSVDVRLIMATNQNLEKLVVSGRFRHDLYYRISVFPVALPPLRDRMASIRALLMDILPDICERLEIEPLWVLDEAVKKLKDYAWPGNIRELENTLEKAAILSDGRVIRASDIRLPSHSCDADRVSPGIKGRMASFEREIIVGALRRFDGSRNAAANWLGIGRTSLFEKIRKHGIRKEEIGEENDNHE